ncbi:hypothetical protein [Micropruina sonneratiae]|uniref:hypothetical protein n=1 Tax=Micropruina sonneratiae TaxID=2986940 RepID=UPI002225EC15|nr:hypothetical protein [Micropruina sp. KQZ13P-5]MCW3157766.1 hypothetical protein [Micropruina sp. KQZ13P-5]
MAALLDAHAELVVSGTAENQGRFYEIAGYHETVEPLLRRGATLELDARRPVGDLADAVEAMLEPQRASMQPL